MLWLEQPSLLKLFCQDPSFLAKETQKDVAAFERTALLVPFLAIGVSPLDNAAPSASASSMATASPPFLTWFPIERTDEMSLDSAKETLRNALTLIRDAHHGVLMHLIRNGGKEDVMRLLSRLIDLNWDKGKMMQRQDRASGACSLIDNVASFGLRAVAPVAAKLNAINPDYFRAFPSEIDITQQTRLVMSEKEAQNWADE